MEEMAAKEQNPDKGKDGKVRKEKIAKKKNRMKKRWQGHKAQ